MIEAAIKRQGNTIGRALGFDLGGRRVRVCANTVAATPEGEVCRLFIGDRDGLTADFRREGDELVLAGNPDWGRE